MYATGSIYTKSKFLGLSLAVHNIGKSKRKREREDFKMLFHYIVTLNLMDHDEEYECNIPNAYARLITAGTGFEICRLSLSLSRSILTYPWMELGGKCVVKCEKTGYRSEIEFHCKVSVTCACTPL